MLLKNHPLVTQQKKILTAFILLLTALAACSPVPSKQNALEESPSQNISGDKRNASEQNPSQQSSHDSPIAQQDGIDVPPPATPDLPIVKYLSEHSSDYIYIGQQIFDRPSMGYTLNYMHEFEPERKAEFYIFPVPEELYEQDRGDVIFGFTKHSLNEFLEADSLGYISETEILEKTAWKFNGTVMTEVSMTYRSDDYHKLSLLFLSEYNHYILRARITMANIEKNKSHKSRDFVRKTFMEIINGLEHEAEKAAIQ